ncbi:MAG: protein-glutamate O-methyltransferase CheR [Acidobacteriota bacterium]
MHSTPSLSLEELALFNELFASHFGLFFPEHKREILESRLLPRLRANHLHKFLDYYLLLQYDYDRELDALTRAITNNESYFFRETGQFLCLQGAGLEELKRGARGGRLHLLSAGCSSGEEPYTLNIYLREGGLESGSVGDARQQQHRIDAIDLDTERLERAHRGLYRRSSLRALDSWQKEKYFIEHGPESYELKERYRQGVTFKPGNILKLEKAVTGPYDVVFCRNVLIYFSEPALKTVIENFAQIVRPGGLLFLGHSESIIGLTQSFQAERLGTCIAYRRKDA